ncbi:ATP-grasp domain-containing protein [Lacihabitans lacunae]|uniref:RimK family alpha-L-glutamate ligase n=1 Tax=Lacihabitans lacunae TaxID=1028214 RepID=A0ABV7YY13_9BACT
MTAWVIYRHSLSGLTEKDYEIHRLIDEAEKLNFRLEVFSPEQFEIIVNREDRKSILIDGQTIQLPDFVIPRLGAGTSYFALSVIRHFERLGVYVLNSSLAIDTVKDKLFTVQIMAENGFPIPNTILAKFPIDMSVLDKHFKFPLVVKSLSGSKGSGVFLCKEREMFEDLLALIQEANPKSNFILQEYISHSHGRDLRVLVLGGQVLCAMERKSQNDGFKANYSLGGTTHFYEVDKALEALVLQIASVLALDFSGIDLLFDQDGFKVCEVNSSPGFKGMELANERNIAKELLLFASKNSQSKIIAKEINT